MDELPDPLAAVEAALARLGGGPPPPTNRKARRRTRAGTGAGEGKHPLGATKPLLSERRADRRRKGRR